MIATRRDALKSLSLGTGATLLSPLIQRVMARAEGIKSSPRFIFVIQGNGFDAIQACPESIPFKAYKDCDKHEEFPLKDHELPKGMEHFEKIKDRLTIIQGLSGRCTGGGHSVHGGALGLYRTSPASRSPANITIDYKLGKTNLGILPWIGVGMSSGGSTLMNMTASAAHKSVPILMNPESAYNAFFSVAAGGEAEKKFHLKRNLLDYMVSDIKRTKKSLGRAGGSELESYLSSYDELAKRQYSLLKHRNSLAKSIKPMDDTFSSEVATERMAAQFEIASTALIGGLTNVATVTCAATELNTSPYAGIGISDSVHTIGHRGGNKRDSKGTADYQKYRGWLFGLIAKMVKRFEQIPDGDGTFMDNTVIVFLSDAPDTHHSTAYEWPFLLIGNISEKMNLGGRYITYPGYGKNGHRTVGSFYTTLLNVAGINDQYFGCFDTELGNEKMQTGPLSEILL